MINHKSTVFALLFLFFKPELFSQSVFIKGLVLSQDSNPVPYATIYDGSLQSGTFSDSLGRFSMNMPDSLKDLHISAIGFKNKTITVGQNDNLSDLHIVLLNDTFNLKEVVISSKIFKPKHVKLGPRKKTKGHFVICGYSHSHEVGIYVPNHGQIRGEIKSVEVYLNKENEESRHLIRLRIYSVDESLYPARDLLLDNIFLQVRKSQRDHLVKIDLEKYGIALPANGIVIALEAIDHTCEPYPNSIKTQNAGAGRCSNISAVLVDDETGKFIRWNRINKEKWHHIDFAAYYRQHGFKVRNLVPYVKLTINEYVDRK